MAFFSILISFSCGALVNFVMPAKRVDQQFLFIDFQKSNLFYQVCVQNLFGCQIHRFDDRDFKLWIWAIYMYNWLCYTQPFAFPCSNREQNWIPICFFCWEDSYQILLVKTYTLSGWGERQKGGVAVMSMDKCPLLYIVHVFLVHFLLAK